MQSSQRERYVDVAWDSRPIITAGLKIQFLAHQSAPNPARLEREFIRTQQQHSTSCNTSAPSPTSLGSGYRYIILLETKATGYQSPAGCGAVSSWCGRQDQKAASVDWAVPITPAPRELCEHWRLPNSIHSRNYNVMN